MVPDESMADMGIWRSIFGWRALFRWDALGAVVPGIFLAGGLGALTIDWFPHHLLIGQICLGIAAFLCIVKIIGHAIESDDTPMSRVIFAGVLCIVTLSIGTWVTITIQKHKAIVEAPPPPPPPKTSDIKQDAKDSNCSNIVAQDVKIKCEIEKAKEKQHDKPEH